MVLGLGARQCIMSRSVLINIAIKMCVCVFHNIVAAALVASHQWLMHLSSSVLQYTFGVLYLYFYFHSTTFQRAILYFPMYKIHPTHGVIAVC